MSKTMTQLLSLSTSLTFLSLASSPCGIFKLVEGASVDNVEDDENPCYIYLAESTIPNSGIGYFAGKDYRKREIFGRSVGDPAFPTVDHNFNVSPVGRHMSKHNEDYHWPFKNYDWSAKDLGMDNEAEDVSVTSPGMGAVANCHFRLLNADEQRATYDNAGLDRYTSPGAGAISPWFNRTSRAIRKIVAGTELFVDYGSRWFTSRTGVFDLVPVSKSYHNAQNFLEDYGELLVGSRDEDDLLEENMILSDDAQRDLWEIIKTFPYPTREREALPETHTDAIRAIHDDIRTVQLENSIRPLDWLKEHGKCVDNIVPGRSSIPHAGRGAFATRFISKGGLVAPAPLVHIADKSNTNMYAEMPSPSGKSMVRNETALLSKQIIINYAFSHPNSTMMLVPYSSNVNYINHDQHNYNAELRWVKDEDFSFFHHEKWLNKSVEYLENFWTPGLMLEFIATRDIEPGEEVTINYGDDWQKAWDEHVNRWKPIPKELDYNNLTIYSKPSDTPISGEFVHADKYNDDEISPILTVDEQKIKPYPACIEIACRVNLKHGFLYPSEPESVPFYKRAWNETSDYKPKTLEKCSITERDEKYFVDEDDDDEHRFVYSVAIETKNKQSDFKVKEKHVITNVPWKAIRFRNKHYTSDLFLKGAFRHEMALPEGVFPEAWMNLLGKKEQK